MLSMSDHPIATQLHVDRTARLLRGQRMLWLSTFRSPLFTRKEQRTVTARVAPTC